MAACRTIKGVVYDLKATDRKAPCERQRASKPKPAPKPKPKPAPKPKPSERPPPAPAASSGPRSMESDVTQYSVRQIPAGGGYEVIEWNARHGSSRIMATNYPTKDEADDARRSLRDGKGLPKRKTMKVAERRYPAAPIARTKVRVNDYRVLDRQERERGHAKREQAAAVVNVASNRSVGSFNLRQQKPMALPPPIDPSKAQRGQRVSVFNYAENEPAHGTLIGLPGDKAMHGVDAEPTVEFESGSNAGMKRHIRWERMFPGWLDPNVNWKPWRG